MYVNVAFYCTRIACTLIWLFVFVLTASGQSRDEDIISLPASTSSDTIKNTTRSTTGSNRSITRFLEVGISANAYRGDLAMKYQKWASSFHIGLKLNFKERLNSHINLSIGNITGQNPDYQFTGTSNSTPTPNLYFKSTFLTANYDLQLNLLKHKSYIVYLSQGFGIIRFKPKNDNNELLQNDFDSRPANETYSNVSLILPTQIGAIYILPNGFGTGIQAGWLNQQTDYLDNISLWGNRKKKDNTLLIRLSVLAPISFK